MPVTPKDAKDMREASSDENFSRLCSKIDVMLVTLEPSQGGWRFATKGYPQVIVDRCAFVYTGLGWKVERISDDRDGDHLLFKER